ncbi:MAG TPA: hypothetical protein DEA88_10525 [Erwinia persicina]|uniref:contractile injection system protein, VgrG/Pvc8 family n=1 Tax=Erwinia persicina TaxID=55211 RepID=UPI000E9E67B3|nr:hypothetical protein [Erwinia persicina]
MSGTDIGAQMAPDFLIKRGDNNISENFRARLLSLQVTDKRGMEADTLTIELDDSDGKIIIPQRGELLSVYIGWQGAALFKKGSFSIAEITHKGAADQLMLTGFSADIGSVLKEKRSESYDRLTLGELVQRIAQRNKLEASLLDTLAAIYIEHVDQTDESDMQFISRQAKRYGTIPAIKFGKLMLIKPGNGTTASGEPLPDLNIRRQEGDSHQLVIQKDALYTGASARWLQLDKASSGLVTVEAGDNHASEAFLPLEKHYLRLPGVFSRKEEAQYAAQAKWEEIWKSSARLTFKLALGRADIIPEMRVEVSGFKQLINEQKWVVTEVTHTINAATGFRTAVTLEIDNRSGVVFRYD